MSLSMLIVGILLGFILYFGEKIIESKNKN